MTDKYILVKVRDATSEMPPNVIVERGQVFLPTSNLAKVRKAIHKVSEEQFISVADMVTHSAFMTDHETEQVTRIFETAMARVKRGHRK